MEDQSKVFGDDFEGRANYYARKVLPPDGSSIRNIRKQELDFRRDLVQNTRASGTSLEKWIWKHRGPVNIGGRTRALAQDVSNSKILLAGGVSGGMWRSTDKGKSWTKVIDPSQHHGVTCVLQDTRPGREHIWYFGTGEGIGNSASDYAASYLGNGVYKSIDSGKTWVNLSETENSRPQNFTSSWDLVYELDMDDNSGALYAATFGTIQKSVDDGMTWETVLDGGSQFSTPLYTDVEVSASGAVFATISNEGEGSNGGVFYSSDGDNFSEITPAFAENMRRMVIEIDPHNEDIIYIFGYTPGSGKMTQRPNHDPSYASLWKYDAFNMEWTDLSQNLPSLQYRYDGVNLQTGYNIVIEVSPHNPDHLIIGGTNLLISTSAFTDSLSTTYIGGYIKDAQKGALYRYPNHHPDNHNLVFDSENSLGLISAHDGGVSITSDFLAEEVSWEFLTDGYYTTQCHAVAIDENGTSPAIVCGLQDNGTLFVGSKDPHDPWEISLYGDGSYCALTSDPNLIYGSAQSAFLNKIVIDEDGHEVNKYRIDPKEGAEYLFINPFILDPNDENIMYLASGRSVWRNASLDEIPTTDTNTIKLPAAELGWERYSDTMTVSTGGIVTCLKATKGEDRRLYIGTGLGYVYRVDNPHEGDAEWISVGENLPRNGYVTDIAIDPEDPDKFVVVFSNYKIYSLYYTTDGGETYSKVAGNLEERESGSGNGPSTRTMTILPLINGKKAYILGTSIGLFATDTLIADNTVWIPVANNTIGNVVVEMIKSRTTDNTLVIGTHGNGVYSAIIDDWWKLTGVQESQHFTNTLSFYPNPVINEIFIDGVENPSQGHIKDISGRTIRNFNYFPGQKIDLTDLHSGIYFIRVGEQMAKLVKL